ncbi:MAG: hypothetical protein ACTHMC_14645 [Pseudobacter sp.]|uniref:hypothetical protein n=1 Tax=Pseudobacter sp. TaxID=2045420 RepID=UPI003F7DB3FA
MYRIIISILFTGIAVSGCSKGSGNPDQEPPPRPKEEVIQLQQVDFGNVYHKFYYNKEGLVTRMESHRRPGFGAGGLDTMYQYANFEYNDARLQSAGYYTQSDPGATVYYRAKSYYYRYDQFKQLSYVAGIISDENGTGLYKDTTFYSIDNQGRITGFSYRNPQMNSFKDVKWFYDAAGNLQKPDSTQPGSGRTTTYFSYENDYDRMVSPWRFKNLGLSIFTVLEEEVFEKEIILSYNNLILKKSTEIIERKNSRGEVIESTGENRIVEVVYKYDRNNSPDNCDASAYSEKLENRTVVSRAGGFSHTFSLSSEKKTL